jgi:hypothetical protein
MLFADVIMPFTAAYYAWLWFFPVNILALISEMVVFKIAYRDLSVWSVILGTVGANAVSFLVGSFICAVLLGGIVAMKGGIYSGSDPHYTYYLIFGILMALFLSIYFELRFWQVAYRKRALGSLDKVCALANVVSYVVLLGPIFFLFW